MPLWAWLFSSQVKKMVDELDDRVVFLEHQVRDLKRKLKENGIE